jgi:hypothetical protein
MDGRILIMIRIVIVFCWFVLLAVGLLNGYVSGIQPDADATQGVTENTQMLLWVLAVTILAIGATWFGMRLLAVNNKSNSYPIWNGGGAYDPGVRAAQLGYWSILGVCGVIYFLLGSLLGYQAGLMTTSYSLQVPKSAVSNDDRTAQAIAAESKYALRGADYNASFTIPAGWKVSDSPENETNARSVYLIREDGKTTDNREHYISVGVTKGLDIFDDAKNDIIASTLQRTVNGSLAIERQSRNSRIYDRPELGERFTIHIVFADNGNSYVIQGGGPEYEYEETRAAIEQLASSWEFN